MKKIVPILLSAALFLVGCGGEDSTVSEKSVVVYKEGMTYTETEKGTPEKYYALSYDYLGGETVMPIGGFYAPYASGGSIDGNTIEDLLTEKVFSALKDCYINNMFYSVDRWETGGSNEKLEKALSLCEKYGMGYYVDPFYIRGQIGTRTEDMSVEEMPLSQEGGQEQFQQVFNDITKNGTRNCVLGLMACDEPFPKMLDNLGVISKAFYGLENLGDRHLYTNIIGYWEGKSTLWGQTEPITWDEYMNMVFSEINLNMLSITYYPYTSAETPEINLKDAFNKLGMYRNLAQKFGLPAHRMLQAGGQHNDKAEWIDTVDPYPSEAETLFDVNTSLAYGYKGIQYFTLVQPEHYAYQTGETFDFENRCGLIGGAGNLTRWYYFAQRANKQIVAVDEYLMQAANMGVIVHGDTASAIILDEETPGEEIITSKTFRQLTSVSGDDCIVGCFDYKGGTALYVVNWSRKEKGNVTLAFDNDNYRYKVIQRAEEVDVVGGRMTLTLDAGEGALIVLS